MEESNLPEIHLATHIIQIHTTMREGLGQSSATLQHKVPFLRFLNILHTIGVSCFFHITDKVKIHVIDIPIILLCMRSIGIGHTNIHEQQSGLPFKAQELIINQTDIIIRFEYFLSNDTGLDILIVILPTMPIEIIFQQSRELRSDFLFVE